MGQSDSVLADIARTREMYSDCVLCPRKCHADRYAAAGYCCAGTVPKLARAAMHYWEEPCISGYDDTGINADTDTGDKGAHRERLKGSGAVFFSNCTLKCVFCQNHEISSGGFGREISAAQLADIFLRLEEEGAYNINLVTATHYLPDVITALDKARPKLNIPVVYNCGGYESTEALGMLDGYIDIYLPDIKYLDDSLAVKYSGAPHYAETVFAAVAEMIRQTGAPVFESERSSGGKGLLKKGVIIRHMVLPGCRRDSMALLDKIAAGFGTEDYLISLMSQYTPFYRAACDDSGKCEFPEISRRVTSFEYESVVRHAVKLGMKGYMQQRSSAKEEYTPPFNLEGIP